ncbi:MAG: hypothetical protein MJ239_02115 [Bacilli bacterium]|nr:hypothetical protein [Bacilli bacterium]
MKFSKFLMMGFLPLFALTGCNNTPSENKDETMFLSFEEGYNDLNSAVLINYFGKASLNTVPEFVKEGKCSALLQPTGVYGVNRKPLIYFPLSSNLYNFNKGDITKYDSVSFAIYNASDRKIEGATGFVSDVVSVYKVGTTKIGEMTLLPRQWNEFTFTIDHAYCNLFFNIQEAPGLYFEFENMNVKDPSFAPSLYLDAVSFKNAATPHVIHDDFVLEENEICDFEKDFQQYFLACNNYFEDALKFKITDDVDGIKASHGKKFLCIDVKAGSVAWADWSSTFLTERYMSRTKIASLDLEEEASQYRFEYDIRFVGTPNSDNNRVVTRFMTRGETKSTLVVPCIDESKPLDQENIVAPENEWCTMGFTFCKNYTFAGQNYCLDTNFTGVNTGKMEFSIGDLEYDYKILIDNIKLVKIA